MKETPENEWLAQYRRGDVAVYDRHAGLKKVIQVPNPHDVAVNPRTKQVYVLAGKQFAYTQYGYN